MKNYNHEKIDELLQPLMKMMQEEFPNGFKLIVEPYFAQIVHENTEMSFQSEEMKKCLEKGAVGFAFKEFASLFAEKTPKTDTADAAETK
jgi:hypothetical protein